MDQGFVKNDENKTDDRKEIYGFIGGDGSVGGIAPIHDDVTIVGFGGVLGQQEKNTNGKGVSQNYILAHMWFDLASAAGNEEATIHRDQAATLMMPLQLLEARKLAREWQPASAN